MVKIQPGPIFLGLETKGPHKTVYLLQRQPAKMETVTRGEALYINIKFGSDDEEFLSKVPQESAQPLKL